MCEGGALRNIDRANGDVKRQNMRCEGHRHNDGKILCLRSMPGVTEIEKKRDERVRHKVDVRKKLIDRV